MPFTCIKSCGASFLTERGLDRHQEHCEEFLAADEVQNTLPNALEIVKERRAAKKRKREEELQALEAGPAGITDELQDQPPIPSPPIVDVEMAPSPPTPVVMGRGGRTKKLTWKLLEQLPAAPTPLPPQPPGADEIREGITGDDRDETPPPVAQLAWQAAVRTARNIFGLFREYPTWPTHNPDDTVSLDDLSNTGTVPTTTASQFSAPALPNNTNTNTADENPYHPFSNATIFWLMNWMWTGSPMKSVLEMMKLVGFLKSDEFNKEDLADFDIRKETARFDKTADSQPTDEFDSMSSPSPSDGWMESDVIIQVPDGEKHTPDTIPTYTIPGLHHRSLVEVIKRMFSHLKDVHYTPFKNFWQNDEAGEAERIHDELFSSDAMLEAHAELQQQPPEPGCGLERVVAALMFWSDATHLANFGNAALWPIYLWSGNQSKWNRGKPSMGFCQHIAYIPKLPDSFEDDYFDRTGKPLTPELLTHCRRELLHAVWKCILDGTFMHAYKHGIVIACPDGISRRFYPRIFTYSADYPEKVLLSTIRNFGRCPCSRCTIPKEKIPDLGTKFDSRRREKLARRDDSPRRFNIRIAREFIYEGGYGVKSAAVERILGADSSVPTENAFSILAEFRFNFFAMLAPDLLHEFELGVWKAVLIHLIRILFANGGNSVQAMNRRYRQVPTFGRSTIRRFSDNVAGLKKLAARNFEDLLQCAIPVFDGLLDGEDNEIILNLLFILAEWHALAKLRLHTDSTVRWLEQSTTELGHHLRQFESVTCSHFDTRELPKEAQARVRRQARKTATSQDNALAPSVDVATSSVRGRGRGTRGRGRGARGIARGASPVTATIAPNPPLPTIQQPPPVAPHAAPASEPRPKKQFNLHLIKLHALGDYASFITRFGTTDSYSTQSGELEHRMVKRFYARTNKNQAVMQMTRLERRNQVLVRQARTIQATRRAQKEATKSIDPASVPVATPPHVHPRRQRRARLTVAFRESEPLPSTPPESHHHISASRNFPVHLHSFILDNEGDPAIENFYDKLQDHLLGRLLHPDWSGGPNEFSIAERRQLWIANDRFYRHKVMRVNFTGYDVRRGQDSINSRNHADIITLSRDENSDHPFRYARVIGIFHVDVIHNVPGASAAPTSKEVLWVRWFQYDKSYRAGFAQRRLHRIHFMPSSDPTAFGFLDPDEVIRACHLAPVFKFGATEQWLAGQSVARGEDEFDDWKYFYVKMFVDRDMYMRYAGGGVGHYRVALNDRRTPAPAPMATDEQEAADESSSRHDSEPSTSDITAEQLRQEAEAAGADTIDDPQDQDVDDQHREELTLEEEDEFEDGGDDDDLEHDVGAEDGEDGAGDLEDEEGYADL